MKKTIGYISSTKKNDIEREVELKVQKERIAKYCKENKLTLLEIYEEPKESSEDYKSELFRLLNDSNKQNFKHVIVLSVDRIALDNVAKVWVFDELKKNGIKLHSLTEDLVLDLDTDEKILEKAEIIKNRVRDIPSLPEIINKVIELVQNPNSSALQLAKIIENDAGLTARVLKMVNSAYYGFPKQISSIQHSIAILGFNTIRGLVLSSSIFKIFAPIDNEIKMLDYKKLWKHCFICAIIAKNINKILKVCESDNLFSATILHDIGKIILDQYDHANYIMALTEFSQLNETKNLSIEKKYCGLNHCETGHLISEHWNLPEIISQVIRYHHSPDKADIEHQKTVTVVAIANLFSYIYENKLKLQIEYFEKINIDILNINTEKLIDLYYYSYEDLENNQNLDDFIE